MNYKFKNKNNNRNVGNKKSENPNFVWVHKVYDYDMSFEEKVQLWIKESKERCSKIKTEFISNTEMDKMALKKAKERR